ncbi:hypothetical protein, partial [Roseovarius sp. D0-M9]|uniref:hypothetical protein n=1 Tax=Roseovarius sp. D0-M9 TaxID=3127117 RepID=UPI0030102225
RSAQAPARVTLRHNIWCGRELTGDPHTHTNREEAFFSRPGIKSFVKALKKEDQMRLKEARKNGKLEKFIEKHEADPIGDLDKLDALIKRPTQGSAKATPKASPEDASGG